MADPMRGISRDRDFLGAHYRALGDAQQAGDLVLNTGDLSVSLAARSVADWLLEASQ